MPKKILSITSIEEKLTHISLEKADLEAQRDQALLKLLHESGALGLNPLILAGVLLEAVKAIKTNSIQKEVWRSAGEKFLQPKKSAKSLKTMAKAENQSTTLQSL